LGFVPRGRFVGPVDEAVFSLPIGQVSDPIQTEFGWHVIEVLEREERELSPSDYSFTQRQAYSNWLSDARAAANIQDFWSIDKAPEADPSIFQTPIAPVTQ
jgi:peptidyl-prolyl cis-trans isomerase C